MDGVVKPRPAVSICILEDKKIASPHLLLEMLRIALQAGNPLPTMKRRFKQGKLCASIFLFRGVRDCHISY